MADGADGTDVTAGIKYAGYLDLFGDPETIDVSFLIVGSTRTAGGDLVTDHNTIVNELITLAESRKDCIVVASPRKASVVNVSSESTQVSNVKADYAQ